MPIYEYRCDNGHTFDVMQRISEDSLTTCQVCEAPVQKVLHAPAVHFKGSGFYTTDYGKQKNGGGGSSESKKEKAESSGASASSSDSGSSNSGSSSSDSSSSSKSDSAKAVSSKSD
jgi:putative FmdB family regulatory protein